jgi:hypothetical protein
VDIGVCVVGEGSPDRESMRESESVSARDQRRESKGERAGGGADIGLEPKRDKTDTREAGGKRRREGGRESERTRERKREKERETMCKESHCC